MFWGVQYLVNMIYSKSCSCCCCQTLTTLLFLLILLLLRQLALLLRGIASLPLVAQLMQREVACAAVMQLAEIARRSECIVQHIQHRRCGCCCPSSACRGCRCIIRKQFQAVVDLILEYGGNVTLHGITCRIRGGHCQQIVAQIAVLLQAARWLHHGPAATAGQAQQQHKGPAHGGVLWLGWGWVHASRLG